MLYILYKNSGVYSGRALRNALDKLYKGTVRGGFPKRFENLLRKGQEPTLVINLGSTDPSSYRGTILNTQDMVRAASNKKQARVAFQEAGVPIPSLFCRTRDISRSDLPVIGRTSYHKKGQGFWFCKTQQDLARAADRGATHFLEFVSNTREYRVHTFIKGKYQTLPVEERTADHYVSVKVSEKVWQGKGTPNSAEPQKNHQFGWIFLGQQNRRGEELDVVRYSAKQAIATLGMDFGAVDVMYKLRTKQPFVLEVNSSPSLSDDNANTCEVYAKRILKTVNQDKED